MILITLAVIILIALGIYAYYGGFAKVNIRVETLGGETIIYKEVQGDYKQTSAISDEMYSYISNNSTIKMHDGIAIFYDDPKKIATDKLRSDVGYIIEPKDIESLGELGDEYKIKTLPVEQAVTTEFPFKGNLSAIISFLRVYPAIEKYIQEHNLDNSDALIEIYSIQNKNTVFRKIFKE